MTLGLYSSLLEPPCKGRRKLRVRYVQLRNSAWREGPRSDGRLKQKGVAVTSSELKPNRSPV